MYQMRRTAAKAFLIFYEKENKKRKTRARKAARILFFIC
jgi:hypothetical protein